MWSSFRRVFITLTIMAYAVSASAAEVSDKTDQTKDSGKKQASVLNTVVVTGENTERSLRDTASSVMVITKEDLSSFDTANNVLDYIPNIVTVEPGNEAPAVRGVDGTGPASGANAFLTGTRPRLNYQIDGRTLGFNEALFQDTSLWDVDQVEVYRGPQSTQQGRNSIAGAIVIHTADPTFDWESRIRLAAGEQSKRVASFMTSGPIIDNRLAFRLAADYQSSKTAVDYDSYPEEDDPDLYKSETIRGKLLFQPSRDIRTVLTLSRTDNRAPQSERVIRPFEDREAQFPNQPVFESVNNFAILDFDWEMSENVQFTANLSRTDFNTERHTPVNTGNLEIEGDEIEFQPMIKLNTSNRKLSGFIGAYILRTDQDEEIDIMGGGEFYDETKSNSLLAEVSWWFTESHTLTIGARYEVEERRREGAAGPLAVDYDKTYKEFLPKITLSWDTNENWTLGFTAGRGYNGGGAGITFSAPFVSYTYDPEYVWNYEAFARATMLDGKLILTSNLFYNDFEDMQLPFYLGPSSTVIRNAKKASTYGLELGAMHLFSPGNSMFANVGLLKTKVDEYDDPTIEGNDLARAPAYSLGLGFTVAPVTNLSVSADMRYTDAYYSDATNTARGKVDPYSVINARVAYTWGPAQFYAAVTNILDSEDEVSILTGTTADDDAATLLKPRTFSAGIEYRF